MSYKQYPDIIIEGGTSINVSQYYGIPTSSSIVLQAKSGSRIYVNNTGTVLTDGYALVNYKIQTFDTLPNSVFLCNPGHVAVRVAVAEYIKGQ